MTLYRLVNNADEVIYIKADSKEEAERLYMEGVPEDAWHAIEECKESTIEQFNKEFEYNNVYYLIDDTDVDNMLGV